MQRPAAVILIIIDGLADISATPLQQAYTPTLDKAARYGRAGLIDPVSPGLACGSDTAHLAIFGYDPTKCYRGRGAFESMGAGMDVQPGDVAFKCNFAWMDDETGIVASRCAEKSEAMSHVAEVLVETLTAVRLEAFPGVEIDLVHAGEHRCGVVIRDRDAVLSDMVTNTDPLLDNKPLQKCEPKDVKNPAATRTADVVNEFTHVVRRILRKHPKNIIASVKKRPVSNVLLLRGASERIHVPTFEEMHGVKSFLIAPTKIIAGIGMTVGIDIIKARGATGTYNTDLISKAHACVESLMLHDNGEAAYKYALGIIHVKAVDEAVRSAVCPLHASLPPCRVLTSILLAVFILRVAGT